MHIQPGTLAPAFATVDVFGRRLELHDYRGRAVMLSFYRFASCPFCNLRVNRLIQSQAVFADRGLDLIAVFQSSEENIRKHVGEQKVPFPILADPGKRLYEKYGIESSGWAIARAAVLRIGDAARAISKGFLPKDIDGDKNIVPADFLIDEEGVVRVAYYGKDIGDHLPIERIEAWLDVRRPPTLQTSAPG